MDDLTSIPDPGEQSSASSGVISRYIHSHIYDDLVTYDEDLVGLISYGLYQKKKRRWILAFETKNKISPTEDEVKNYCFTFQSLELAELRVQAETLLYGVSDAILEERMPGVRETALNSRITSELEQLKGKIHSISGYKHHVVGHVVGFFVLVLLASAVTFALSHEPSIAEYLLNKAPPAR